MLVVVSCGDTRGGIERMSFIEELDGGLLGKVVGLGVYQGKNLGKRGLNRGEVTNPGWDMGENKGLWLWKGNV